MQNQKFKNLISKICGSPTSPISGGKSDFPNIRRSTNIWISDFQVNIRKSDILNQFQKFLIFIVALGLIIPNFSFAQEQFKVAAPQTMEEVKGFTNEFLTKLPDAVKRVWEGEAMPVWKKMWSTFWEWSEPWRDKLLNLLRIEVQKRQPDIEKEIEKEKEAIKKDLWQRFKELFEEKFINSNPQEE